VWAGQAAGTSSELTTALYRLNLSQTNPAPQPVAEAYTATHFWLSIDGTTVFYADKSPQQGSGVFAVGSDGNKQRMLRQGIYVPIGYAENNALMVMKQVQGTFQIVRLGARSSDPDTVIMANAGSGRWFSLRLYPEPGALGGLRR